jgi:TolA-binding protein
MGAATVRRSSPWLRASSALVVAGLLLVLLLASHSVVSARHPATSEALASSSAPPLKAVVVKLQLALLDRERTIAQLQQRIADLEQQQLQTAIKNGVELELLKDLNAKPGDTFDWNSLALKPAPAAAA